MRGELDGMYSYAQSCLLAFAFWMLENEVPYFDSPEKLEFPTEAWGAQELRKANVLRLAARHAGEPLRSRLIIRGNELAERAWSDLLRFKSRDVARAVAIMLVEGTRDAYLRSRPAECTPLPIGKFEFGSPQVFVSQKRRVLNQLRTPRGILRAFRALTGVGRWRRLLSR